MKLREPNPEDFLTDEDYEKALEAYEDALYWKIEEAMEDYYENR